MPTKFTDIYDRAIFKFTDYTFLTIISDFKEAVLQNYLLSSVVDFQPVCTYDLSKYDLEKEEFEETLGLEEIDILATGIAVYWLNGQALNKELLKNRVYSTGYNGFSPANLLKEIHSLKADLEMDYWGKINVYSFRHGSIETLKV